MKKLIAFAVMTVAAVSLATAEIAVGVRGIFGIGLGTTTSDGFDFVLATAGYADNRFDFGNSLDFGGTAFVKIPVSDSLVIQPEFGFTHNMIGRKCSIYGQDVRIKVSYNAIDIPVLVGWDFKVADGLTVTPLVGPKFSIPVGDGTVKIDVASLGFEIKDDFEIDNIMLFSIVVGAEVAYRLGPGALVGDLRYNIGISDLNEDVGFGGSWSIATPRALQLSVGYQISF